MAASFPTSVKSFTTKTAGAGILSEHVNDIQAEVVAIETALGINPAKWTFLAAPLTSTSWDNDQKTTGDRGVIDLSAVFSAPANIKAVLLSLQFTPTTAGDYFRVGPSATYNYCLTCRGQVASVITHAYGSVPCDANGDIYFYNSATTPTVAIMIWGYFL